MTEITLLHTADVHCQTFDRLRDEIAPNATLSHIVRPDWLERARAGTGDALREDIAQAISTAQGPVLCTCTTLGPLAEDFGAVRIDMPMMQEAAKGSGDILLVYALDSTAEASLTLLQKAVDDSKDDKVIHTLSLAEFWPLFEAGELTAFHASIAAATRHALQSRSEIGTIVLAQASMAGAAPLLSELQQRVLSSPELALRHMLTA